MASRPHPFHVGLDENGMGPRLGPLVVTSILAEVGDGAERFLRAPPRGSFAERVGDSKALLGFGNTSLGEAWARVIAGKRGSSAARPSELLGELSLDAESVLKAPCPSHHSDLCWEEGDESFAAPDPLRRECERDLERLEGKGVRIVDARVVIVCVRRLNESLLQGKTRLDVDLHAMERLVLGARERAGEEVHAHCGKVGGIHYYGNRFGPLAERRPTALREGRARSEYDIRGVGRMAFLRDAESGNLLVALASLVGKWVRDTMMRRIVSYHRERDGNLGEASGYHDSVTTRFVHASALVRKRENIDDTCFERRSLHQRG